MIENWVPDKLPSFHFVHRDPSDHPESIFETQKLQDGRTWTKTDLHNSNMSENWLPDVAKSSRDFPWTLFDSANSAVTTRGSV